MEPEAEQSTPRPWSIDYGAIDPHEFDYKRRLRDNSIPIVRDWIERRPDQPPLPLESMLATLVNNSDCLAYERSSSKRGVFLQTSCVLTSRDAVGRRDSVLLQLRSSTQFHDPADLRNLAGTACLIGTVVAKGTFLDDSAQISNDIFPRIIDGRRNALALFGRKLLVPAPEVRSRFVGLGFNYAKWHAEGLAYLHLIWEVTVDDGRLLDPAMVVPERATKAHDPLLRTSLAEASKMIDAKARIDRAVMEHLLDRSGRPRIGDDVAGLLGASMFALPSLGTKAPASPLGARVRRDAIVFDLMRMFQTSVHRGTTVVAGDTEVAFQEALFDYITNLRKQLNVLINISREGFLGRSGTEGQPDFYIRVGASTAGPAAAPHWEYLIECKVSDSIEFAPKSIQQCEEYSARGVRPDDPKAWRGRAECVILLQGVRGSNGVRGVGGFETIRPSSKVFGLRVALDWRAPSKQLAVVEVAHALVPVRVGSDMTLVVVQPRTGGDRPRLLGGRMDGGVPGGASVGIEPAHDGILRELSEELGLEAADIAGIQTVLPGESDDVEQPANVDPFFPAIAVSRSSGKEVEYRFFAHVVALSSSGQERLREHLRAGESAEGHDLYLVTLDTWTRTGLGFRPEYAQRCRAAIRPSKLIEAATSVDPNELGLGVRSA